MLKKISIAVALALSSQAFAADNTYFDNFTPLANSVGALPDATPVQLSSPFFSQLSVASRITENSQVPGSNSGNWDMIDADASGRYLFMPFETSTAGVMRYDIQTGIADTIVAPGTFAAGQSSNPFVVGDASRITPWGSYLTAEESWGTGSTKGRLFELNNPTTALATTSTTNANFIQRTVLPRVSHEGLAFDAMKNLYFIDEVDGGSIYKYTSNNANATNGNDYFASGQTFVAMVNGGNNNVSATGNITWSAITDVNGAALAGVSLLATDGTIDGRASANALLASNYQRPEDMEIVTNALGQEVMYFATTSTHEVFAFNLDTNQSSLFANRNSLLVGGAAVGTEFTSPDNIAFDANNNLYIIEDQPGAVSNDIWFANDINKDGDITDAGEGLQRWASNGTVGSEFTGLYFSKTDPNLAFVNIQHPSNGNDRLIQITAVPEPETYAMLIAGLGLVGFAARRRKA